MKERREAERTVDLMANTVERNINIKFDGVTKSRIGMRYLKVWWEQWWIYFAIEVEKHH